MRFAKHWGTGLFGLAVSLVMTGSALAQTGAMGCQALVSAVAESGRVTLDGVLFDFNRSSLRSDSLPALAAAREAITTLGGEWVVEGHTDSVGSHEYNQQLSQARAQAVADWLIAAGTRGAQLRATGFSYDRPVADNGTEAGRALNRRVELVALSPDFDNVGFGGPADVEAEGCGTNASGDVDAPAIADWSGAGGYEWLPFSLLMPTGDGGETGWRGERIEMAVGTQAESCRALCLAEDRCGAFSFEPSGSFFVEAPRCALIGFGTEMNLSRQNGYQDDGTFFASGLKPDARLLTAESQEVAAAILADMAEVEGYRSQLRFEAPTEVAAGAEFGFRVSGVVPMDRHRSFAEIAELGDYAFHWYNSKSAVFADSFAGDGSGVLTAPEPGSYTLRYAVEHETFGTRTLAEQVLVVSEGGVASVGGGGVVASGAGGAIAISGPERVRPGETITVKWSAINDPGDWVTIVPAGSDEGSWLDYKYVGGNTSDTLTVPDAAGLYEVRYVRDSDYATLGMYVIEAVAQGAMVAPPVPESTPYETVGMGEDEAPAAAVEEDFTTAFMRESGIGAMLEDAVKDDPEAAQMLEMLGGLLGTGRSSGSSASPSRGAPPPVIAQLGGRIVDIGDMSAEDVLAILLPRRVEGR